MGEGVFVKGRLLLVRVTAGESVFRKRVFFFWFFPILLITLLMNRLCSSNHKQKKIFVLRLEVVYIKYLPSSNFFRKKIETTFLHHFFRLLFIGLSLSLSSAL